jgi:hypothetical protein
MCGFERSSGVPLQPHVASMERPVALIVPPETAPHLAGEVLTLPTLPEPPPDTPLVLGLATVDHSGRIRDRLVLAALAWGPGDRTSTTVRRNVLLLRRTDSGVAIDARGRVFLPAGARALLGIDVDERVTLVAIPQKALLAVHPARVVTALLAESYADYVHTSAQAVPGQ